jgi:hypothetical protein
MGQSVKAGRCMARLIQNTDAGGGRGVVLEFLFCAAIPLALAVAHPAANVLPAEAELAGKRGLTEATETIPVFFALCVWPEHSAVLAYGFAGLCAVTTGMRVN